MGITAEEDFNRTRDELKSEAEILLENVEQSKHLDIIHCNKCNWRGRLIAQQHLLLFRDQKSELIL